MGQVEVRQIAPQERWNPYGSDFNTAFNAILEIAASYAEVEPALWERLSIPIRPRDDSTGAGGLGLIPAIIMGSSMFDVRRWDYTVVPAIESGGTWIEDPDKEDPITESARNIVENQNPFLGPQNLEGYGEEIDPVATPPDPIITIGPIIDGSTVFLRKTVRLDGEGKPEEDPVYWFWGANPKMVVCQ